MRSFDCTPVSSPALPDCSTHPLWQTWDTAVEHCLLHVHGLQTNSSSLPMEVSASSFGQRVMPPASGGGTFQSPFFNDQLTAFEIWLDFGGPGGSYKGNQEPPVCLPILFQVCTAPASYLYSPLLTWTLILYLAWRCACVLDVGTAVTCASTQGPAPAATVCRTGPRGGALHPCSGGVPVHPEAATQSHGGDQTHAHVDMDLCDRLRQLVQRGAGEGYQG